MPRLPWPKLWAEVRRGITSRPSRAERSTIRGPATETRRSLTGICCSGGAPERPRKGISYSRSTGRARMLPIRPCGRWTISAKMASGRSASSARRWVLDHAVELGVGVAEAARAAALPRGRPRCRRGSGSRPASSASCEAAARVTMTWKASGRGTSSSPRRRRRHAVEVLGGDLDLPLPLGERAVELGEQQRLRRAPRRHVLLGGGAPSAMPRSSGEASAPKSPERSKPMPTSSSSAWRSGISRPSYRSLKSFRKRSSPSDRPVDGEPEQDLEAAHDLLQHRAAERRPVAGLDHVELEEARHLDRRGQLAQGLGHRLVAGGSRPPGRRRRAPPGSCAPWPAVRRRRRRGRWPGCGAAARSGRGSPRAR